MQGQGEQAGAESWRAANDAEMVSAGVGKKRASQYIEERNRATRRVSPAVLSGCARVADALVVVACAAYSYSAYLAGGQGAAEHYYPIVFCVVLLQANLFHFARLYRFNTFTNLRYQLSRVAAAWSLVFVILIALGVLTNTSDTFWSDWTMLWFSSGLLGMSGLRGAQNYITRRWSAEGRLARNVVIVGAGEHGERLVRRLNDVHGADVRIVGIFDDRRDRVPQILEGRPLSGSVDDLLKFALGHRVDQVIVALPWSAENRVLEILQKLCILPVDIRLSPDMIGFRLKDSSFGRIGSVPVVNVSRKPLSDWSQVAKKVEDRVLGAVIAMLAMPVMLGVALLVKLDSPGPVLFRQKRYGFNNQEIEVIKFRTMRQEASLDATAPQAKLNDPRITSIGSFLRRSSLDELPQIFNVLNGTMSLVGPRPHSVPRTEYFSGIVDKYASRHRVKPGITGWAQVKGWRGETDTVEKVRRRVEHDIYYIDHWSLGFDLWILFMTAIVVLRGKNAH